ncbi:MAG: hypothetical protein RBU36_18650, partial [Thermoanaerobaculia bacterium]|nr:hypothetical protein [Thermoanaerobaculia bacterium]
ARSGHLRRRDPFDIESQHESPAGRRHLLERLPEQDSIVGREITTLLTGEDALGFSRIRATLPGPEALAAAEGEDPEDEPFAASDELAKMHQVDAGLLDDLSCLIAREPELLPGVGDELPALLGVRGQLGGRLVTGEQPFVRLIHV